MYLGVWRKPDPQYDRAVRDPQITTLPGGERVVTEHIAGVRSVALGLWIGAGSRDEPRSRAGVSHFIEHLLFKGSSRYGAQDIAELFDAMGGELNAATSRETTVVYTRVPDDHLEQALDAMIDMVFAPSFDDVDRRGRSCSRRSPWSTTTRRISSTTSPPRRCSARTRSGGR